MSNEASSWKTRASEYLETGFKEISGWSSSPIIYQSLLTINEYHTSNNITGSVAEIGVHHGRLFLFLDQLRRVDSEKSLAIDLFEDQSLNIDRSGRGDLEVFESNVNRYSQSSSSVGIYQGDSLSQDLHKWLDEQGVLFRYFSVDGGHTILHAVNDLRTAAKYLAHGGVVVLDDVFVPEWPEVTEGLYAYLAERPPLVPFLYTPTKLFMCSTSFHNIYFNMLTKESKDKSRCKTVRIGGHPVLSLRRKE